jgi:2-polyprenyl-3-methyl-5-hydroxy-6-metoxy-1,4-benzoquinol methylase
MLQNPNKLPFKQWVRRGIGNRISQLGEFLSIDALTYNRIHFQHFHEHAVANAPGVVAAITRQFPDAKRWVDVGAGTGAFSSALKRAGRNVVALERNKFGRKLAGKQGVDARPFDLTQTPPAELDGIFDGSLCFEVAEHLPPSLGDSLVSFITSVAPLAIFTAATPGQGGTGHINEQPREYWIARFQSHGFHLDEAATESLRQGFKAERVPGEWFVRNISVFRCAT